MKTIFRFLNSNRLIQLLVCIYLISASSLFAQETGLIVYVIDQDDSAIPGAFLELVESGEQGISNDDGKCVFRQISGTITLRVRALGFVAQLRKIDGNELTKNKITIQLEEDLLELGEVVINSTAEELAGNEIFNSSN